MAIVKALRRLAAGGFAAIAATDQIQCDAGAMTVTEPGKASKAVPDALAGKADVAGTTFTGNVTVTGLNRPNGGVVSPSIPSPDYTTAKIGGVYALTSPRIAKGAPIDADYATFLNFTNRDTNSSTDTAQYALQICADYFTDNDIYIRNTSFDYNSRPDKGWKKLFHTGNLTGQVILALIGAYAPTVGQFLRALEASGGGRVATVTAAIPSDPGDTTNIAWNHATFVLQAGTLAQFVKTTLSLTDAQLATIISNAMSVVE